MQFLPHSHERRRVLWAEWAWSYWGKSSGTHLGSTQADGLGLGPPGPGLCRALPGPSTLPSPSSPGRPLEAREGWQCRAGPALASWSWEWWGLRPSPTPATAGALSTREGAGDQEGCQPSQGLPLSWVKTASQARLTFPGEPELHIPAQCVCPAWRWAWGQAASPWAALRLLGPHLV